MTSDAPTTVGQSKSQRAVDVADAMRSSITGDCCRRKIFT
jgi:hypothetical protein